MKLIQTIRNAFAIPDLRKKLLFTIFIVVLFRIGTAIPVPFIDAEALKQMMSGMTEESGNAGNLLSYLNILSGRAFENATIFAMGIGPYITAQIIVEQFQIGAALLLLHEPLVETMSIVQQITTSAVSPPSVWAFSRVRCIISCSRATMSSTSTTASSRISM